jgi:hypothetical protein
MAGAASKTAPSSVAEGLGDVLRALVSAMQAPDATAHAKELMDLQARTLTMIHKFTGTSPQQGQAPQGAPPAAAPGGPPPGGMGGPPGGMNLAGLQGQPQGPSAAAQSPISPDMMRQLAAAGAST